jgi:4-hydroxy-tetrahydrodipicolinate synthase
MFKGSFVALITPFKDGRIDEGKIRELVEWQIAQKTSGIVPVGTTGESATLSHKEHARVIEVVVRAVKKRVPVIAGAGSNSTHEAISLTQEAQRLGADAVLSVNPYYNRPTQEGLKTHFGHIARSVNIPVVLYNIPFRTGVNLSVDTMVDLAKEHKNIVGVKESTGSMDQTSEIVKRLGKRFFVLSGDDSLTLPLMSVGAAGVISVAANLVPRTVADMVNAWEKGHAAEAQKLHLKLFPLIKSLFIESNPGPIKAAMEAAGLIVDGSLRSPMVSVLPETRKKILKAMKDFGIKSSK